MPKRDLSEEEFMREIGMTEYWMDLLHAQALDDDEQRLLNEAHQAAHVVNGLFDLASGKPFNRDDYVSAQPGPDWDPED